MVATPAVASTVYEPLALAEFLERASQRAGGWSRNAYCQEAVANAYYAVWTRDATFTIAFDLLSLSSLEALLACEVERTEAMGLVPPDTLVRALRVVGYALARDCGPILVSEPNLTLMRNAIAGCRHVLLRPCAPDGPHTPLCEALPVPTDVDLPNDGKPLCARYFLIHMTLHDLLDKPPFDPRAYAAAQYDFRTTNYVLLKGNKRPQETHWIMRCPRHCDADAHAASSTAPLPASQRTEIVIE